MVRKMSKTQQAQQAKRVRKKGPCDSVERHADGVQGEEGAPTETEHGDQHDRRKRHMMSEGPLAGTSRRPATAAFSTTQSTLSRPSPRESVLSTRGVWPPVICGATTIVVHIRSPPFFRPTSPFVLMLICLAVTLPLRTVVDNLSSAPAHMF